jgi:hypothetical protein
MPKSKIEPSSLLDAKQKFATDLGLSFDSAIKSDIWQWDGVTKRKNGELAGSPRNIVDTGSLLKSRTTTVDSNGAHYTWMVAHGEYVIEKRDFVTYALNQEGLL